MKYIVLIGDGMADRPLTELGGRTPLSAAYKPAMNSLAKKSVLGMVHTVPAGMVPESDTANLAIMGYNPLVYSKGRSPLEAASMGIIMNDDETAIRVNIVAVSDGDCAYEERVMLDHSSDEIPTAEADVLIKAVQERFGNEYRRFYTGISYRHCVIWKNCPDFTDFSRPHDIIGKKIGMYLPASESSRPMRELMTASFELLNNHPLNIARAEKGLKKANSLWLWGPGKKPLLPSFKEKTGLDGSVVCAVDLIKGIGVCAGMKTPFVEGATGTLDTNYNGKLQAAIKELENGSDLVYIHVEAPDECGHRGEIENKVKAIENIDREILSPLLDYLDNSGENYRLLVLPDHPTPICARTHTREPVPFVLYDSQAEIDSGATVYDEEAGQKTGKVVESGEALMNLLISKR